MNAYDLSNRNTNRKVAAGQTASADSLVYSTAPVHIKIP